MILTVVFKNGNSINMKVWNAGLTSDGNLQFSRKEWPGSGAALGCWSMKEIASFRLEEEVE